MKLHERQHEERPAPTVPASQPDDLDNVGATAQRLLAAGDDAIARALSGRSDEFLRANRQHGGE